MVKFVAVMVEAVNIKKAEENGFLKKSNIESDLFEAFA
jgi:hypothetical protein